MTHAEKAVEFFKRGYNCAQAVAMAFSPETGIDEKTTARMISSFGGGMGRMREVCGAVSGMLFVLGYLYGYDDPHSDTEKMAHYSNVQTLAGQFRDRVGSIICRDILKNPPSDPCPTPRNEEFYAKRPCARMVYHAADIMSTYIQEHPHG